MLRPQTSWARTAGDTAVVSSTTASWATTGAFSFSSIILLNRGAG